MDNNNGEVSVPIETARVRGWEDERILYDLAMAVDAPIPVPSQEARRLVVADLTWALGGVASARLFLIYQTILALIT